MTEYDFQTLKIADIDRTICDAARKQQKTLAKPYGSLGRLEALSIQIAGITGSLCPSILRRAVVVFAADNGVFEEGVTPIGQETTKLQCENMARGRAGVAVLAKKAHADLLVVDVGAKHDMQEPAIRSHKIRRGTKNIAKEAAMTQSECLQAMNIGANMAAECAEKQYAMVGVGEMGVGNTTSSSAVASVLLACDPEQLTGRGAGLSDEAYAHKLRVIRHAIEINQPEPDDPMEVVQKVGGFDLAAMCGFILMAAHHRLVVVIDGFISICAALLAVRLQPNVASYLILSHRSAEPGYSAIASAIKQKPLVDFDMRLGEGSGCPIAFQIADMAVVVLTDMATFEEAGIQSETVEDNWATREI